MEVTEENLRTLADYLTRTMDPNFNIRKPAEQFLQSVEGSLNYPLLLLHVVGKTDVDMMVRVAAAVTFKNFIKNNWPVEEEPNKIQPQDREAVKSFIVNLMLNSPEAIQKQLTDAISIIGKHDFPNLWPNLLDEMIEKFQTGNFHVINGVLQTCHSLFKKYRHEFKSQKLWTEIKYVLDKFAKPFTDLFAATIVLSETHAEPNTVPIIYNSLLMISKIFYSLNSQDLPEFFEDNLNLWMKHFLHLLTKDVPILKGDDDEEAGLMEQLKSQIIDNVILYANHYDEEFGPILPEFVTAVWNVLTSVGPQKKYDVLVSYALKFLATAADRKQYQHLFEDPGVLNKICSDVVIPNLAFRAADEELFADNPEEYIRRDIEGSDVDTRRRAACDLVNSFTMFSEEKIVTIFGSYVQSMLKSYAEDAKNWPSKNAAIYMVTSLASRGQTQRFGVTQASSFVNLNDFAMEHVLPELEKNDVNGLPVIKADCLRYAMTFRSVLPKNIVLRSIPLAMKHLMAESVVVHTYAAAHIDKVLLIRDPSTNVGMISAGDLEPISKPLLDNLFGVLNKDGSEENEYVMKAILRVFVTLKEKVIPMLPEILPLLITKLSVIAKNPTKPNFNHALFEAIAYSVKVVCGISPLAVDTFEAQFFPIFQAILQQDIGEFVPYVFQLLAMLLEIRRGEGDLPVPYRELYPFLLQPVLWERKGNVHPLVRLVKAYASAIPPGKLQSEGQLNTLLGIFQKLAGSKANDHEGFSLMLALMEKCPTEILAPNMKAIFTILFQRLTNSKTVKFTRGFVIHSCFYVINYGASNFIALMDSIQPQMFGMVIERIFLQENLGIGDAVERKIVVVGLSKLICEAGELNVQPYEKLQGPLLKLIIRILKERGDSEEGERDDLGSKMEMTYDVAYSKLIYASVPRHDPLLGLGRATNYFVQNLSKLGPERLGNMRQLLSPEENDFLNVLLNSPPL